MAIAGEALDRLAPDVSSTLRRFPLAVLFIGLATAVFLGAINGLEWMREEMWFRAALGLATGAVFATAGVLFTESRPQSKLLAPLLVYVSPFAAAASLQITSSLVFVPYLLPAVSVLWLSVSAFTRIGRGPERYEIENRFWWLNHRAVASGCVALVGFLVIALGLTAIERSLDLLFHVLASDLFYKWLLPFTGLFLVPTYWLSTIPRLSDYEARQLTEPDFLSRAIGFLGQFVLAPFLFFYALILLAYTGEILITQQFPNGIIGWLVLGFVIVGAGTWLVLHPPFLRPRLVVKAFRRSWFWLTLIPLALSFFAILIRVEAYGLTPERVLLLVGDVWALLLAIVFLVGRGDIRLIPGLAGAALLLVSIGPWNHEYLSTSDQLSRLDEMLSTQAGARETPPKFQWSQESAAAAGERIEFLTQVPERRQRLAELLGHYGIAVGAAETNSLTLRNMLGLSGPQATPIASLSLRRLPAQSPVDVSATPILMQDESFYGETLAQVGDINLQIYGTVLRVGARGGKTPTTAGVDLTEWIARQQDNWVAQPWIDFAFAGTRYRFVVEELDIQRPANEPGSISHVSGTLFRSIPPPPVAVPAPTQPAKPPAAPPPTSQPSP